MKQWSSCPCHPHVFSASFAKHYFNRIFEGEPLEYFIIGCQGKCLYLKRKGKKKKILLVLRYSYQAGVEDEFIALTASNYLWKTIVREKSLVLKIFSSSGDKSYEE